LAENDAKGRDREQNAGRNEIHEAGDTGERDNYER